jgi:trk system potassium uptake protein TrkA
MRVIICGAGQVGFNLATYLSENDNHVTVIDQSQELINKINERLDVRAICGFASHPNVLEKAEADDAEMIIAVTQSDEVNIVACETAGSLFNIKTKVARIRTQAYLDPRWSKMYNPDRLNIDLVISPELEVARSIGRSLTVPGAFDIISLSEGKVKIIGVKCTFDTPIVNTPITHLTSLFPYIDICVVGIMRGDQAILPTPNDILHAGDEVYFAVDQKKISEAMRAFGYQGSESRRLLILGGGNIGLCLAQEIEKKPC